ncbi:MAG: nicotinate phosphoribosyltransferase [Bacilli bacterium]|nr:nicotinate phosphoribosyltransferase [Bacilli bacterium]
MIKDKNNYTLLTDFYELTMANGYYELGKKDEIVYFDMFYRKNPNNAGFSIFCGLEQLIEYIKTLHFSTEDIEYLRSLNTFSDGFLEYLKTFKFSGDIYSVEEGNFVFPNEPLVVVRANIIEAQIIETFLLQTINHQSLIATKTERIVRSAKGRPVMEFGARRAQGATASILGPRAAYIAGAAGTSCVLSDQLYNVKALGTMAHSWIQAFPTEYEAFQSYVRLYPDNVVLLVDTYNVLNSGVPNAIKVIKEELLPRGIRKAGIRIDSGDIAYLSKKARKMLDAAGLDFVTICASNSLDEYLIADLIRQNANVDSFGVGERLITSKDHPVFGGVYKLAGIEKDGQIIPKMKISENEGKITNPSFKKVYRIFSKENDMALADVLTLHDEVIPENEYEIFDPRDTWKRKTLTDYYVEELLVPIFKNGELVYNVPSIEEVRKRCQFEMTRLWEEVKRFDNPHGYYVDLSQKLWDLKHQILTKK